MDSILKKSKKGISIGTQVAAHTCNQQVRIVATGNMTSHGTVTAVGHISTTNRNISTTNRSISGKSLSGTAGSCTGAAQTTLPLVGGVYLCLDSIAAVGTEICLRSLHIIDCTVPISDYKKKNDLCQYSFYFCPAYKCISHSKDVIEATALYVGCTTVSSSDNTLKFNERPLNHALCIINRLQPVEYDQAQDLTKLFTFDTS